MEEIDLEELIEIFLNKKCIIAIVVITLLFAVIGGIYNKCFTKPLYTSSTTLLLAQESDSIGELPVTTTDDSKITQTDVILNEKLVSTYKELVKSNSVISKVITNLSLKESADQLRKSISTVEVSNTEILQISVSNQSPTNAKIIANEIANVFIDRINELYNISNIKIVDEAIESYVPQNINPIKYACVGALLGFVGSIGSILVIVLLKNAARSSNQVEKVTNVSVIGTIAKNKKNSDEIITYIDSKSAISEALKAIRTNIKFYKKDPVKTIAITSAVPEEGKSWISSNLAILFAKNGEKVLLLDADMRRGRQHDIFKLEQKNGLSNILKDGNISDVTNYIRKTEIENLDVLTCGEYTASSSELLLSDKFKEVLDSVKNQYDLVILDTTPNSIVTDGIIVSRLVDTNIIITKYNNTNLKIIDNISKNITKVGGNVLGIIINQMPYSFKRYGNTYYYNTSRVLSTKVKKVNDLNEKEFSEI